MLIVFLMPQVWQVLMQTGDTELEMRGRCSAGQKVSGYWFTKF